MEDVNAVTLMHKKATISLPSFFEPIGPIFDFEIQEEKIIRRA
jgi:hypothetical protein